MTNNEAIQAALKILDSCIDPKIENSGAKLLIQNALIKQMPLQPKPDNEYYGFGICASCGAVFMDDSTNYCGNCGQKLYWEKGTENESIS